MKKTSERRKLGAYFATLCILLFVTLSPSWAQQVEIIANLPPPGRFYHAVASDGSAVFIFGGTNGNTYPGGLTDILRYIPATNVVERLSDTLPYDLSAVPAVWVGGKYYLFGGISTSSYSGAVACNGSTGVCAGDRDDILRYDPEAHTIDTVAHLPVGRHAASAIWTGQYIFVFGGIGLSDIVRFNPANNEVAVMGAQLPTCRALMSAVWDGTEALLFGGNGGYAGCGPTTEIVRYNPSTDTVTVAAAAFPSPIGATSAIWDGNNAYIFGGGDGGDTIWQYDPRADTLTAAPVTLPSPRFFTGAALVGGKAFIIGGSSGTADLTEIVELDPVVEIDLINIRGILPLDFTFKNNLGYDPKRYDYEVGYLQIMLAEEGPNTYPESTVDGVFEEHTKKAVQNFQEKYGIEQTGFVGPITRAKLDELLIGYRKNVRDRIDATLEAIDYYYGQYFQNLLFENKPLNFPKGLIQAIAAKETGPYFNFNNELISYDWGRGIMQVTSPTFVGAGECLDDLCKQCKELSNKELSNELREIYKEACYEYYSNTENGVKRNIRDGIYALSQKFLVDSHNCANCTDKPPQGFTADEVCWISITQRYNTGRAGKAGDYVKEVGYLLQDLRSQSWYKANGVEDNKDLGDKFIQASNEKIQLGSPGCLEVYDSQGRVTGLIEGEVKEEIQNSIYDKEEKVAIIFFPNDSYRYLVIGTEQGTYKLTISSYKEEGTNTFNAINIPTLPGAVHQYTIDWGVLSQGGGGVTIQIDSDGNGIFERTVIAGSVLTRDQFIDTIPPATTATISPSPNVAGWNNSNITVTLKATDNAGGSGVKEITYGTSGGQPITVSGDVTSFTISAEGQTTVTFFAKDNAGNTEQAKSIVLNLDKTPPNLTCSASPNTLWPPNHKMIPITTSVNVSDALSGPAGFKLVSVTSNEPDKGLGDGDTPNDVQGWILGTSCTTGQLRAERSGKGTGRIYTLTYMGFDRAGNSSTCVTTVAVPHDQGK